MSIFARVVVSPLIMYADTVRLLKVRRCVRGTFLKPCITVSLWNPKYVAAEGVDFRFYFQITP